MRTAILFGSLGVVVTCLSGCSSTEPKDSAFAQVGAPTQVMTPPPSQPTTIKMTNEVRADLLRPGERLFTLGPGDRIEIEIIGRPASRVATAVGPDGKIYFNLLPGLDVWGLTLDQTRDLLQNQLAKYITNPEIAITLREVGSKYVWLLGRLNHPGIYPMSGTMTLLESLALAGGTAQSASQVSTEELADLRHSFVMRQGQLLPVDFYRLLREGDTTQNIYLQPDDFVYVPSALAQEVYIFGAVRNPRVAPYLERMTLVSAIAGSTGPTRFQILGSQDLGPFMPDAYLSHVAIVRGSLSEPKVMIVNYNDIVKGRALDVPLEAGDIIYIPNSPYTNLKRYVNLVISSFIGTVAANEGIHAGGGNVSVNVSAPVGTGTSVTR